jgi:hypothetical protein
MTSTHFVPPDYLPSTPYRTVSGAAGALDDEEDIPSDEMKRRTVSLFGGEPS